jgi:hypothetical protein
MALPLDPGWSKRDACQGQRWWWRVYISRTYIRFIAAQPAAYVFWYFTVMGQEKDYLDYTQTYGVIDM